MQTRKGFVWWMFGGYSSFACEFIGFNCIYLILLGNGEIVSGSKENQHEKSSWFNINILVVHQYYQNV